MILGREWALWDLRVILGRDGIKSESDLKLRTCWESCIMIAIVSGIRSVGDLKLFKVNRERFKYYSTDFCRQGLTPTKFVATLHTMIIINIVFFSSSENLSNSNMVICASACCACSSARISSMSSWYCFHGFKALMLYKLKSDIKVLNYAYVIC